MRDMCGDHFLISVFYPGFYHGAITPRGSRSFN